MFRFVAALVLSLFALGLVACDGSPAPKKPDWANQMPERNLR